MMCMSHCLSMNKFLSSTGVADRQQHRLGGKSRDEWVYLYRAFTKQFQSSFTENHTGVTLMQLRDVMCICTAITIAKMLPPC